MSHARKVAKNSIWLIVQPLILNVISLFVIGYIARTLGQGDYGRFTFAFAYIAIFMPLTSVGLGSLTTRAIAEDKQGSSSFLGKMLVLRALLSLIVFLFAVAIAFVGGYEPSTRLLVILASATIVFNTISSTLYSAFQGFEKMEYVAYAQFVSGAVLTGLSVAVLYFGTGIIGITIVYVFGSLLAVAIALWLLLSRMHVPEFSFDGSFCWIMLKKGFPFFVPAVMTIISTRFGMIMLQKMSGDSAVGIYGAAYTLVDRLLVIPEGICAAIFPAIAVLYGSNKDEARNLFQRFYRYLTVLAAPLAVGGALLAKPIIQLIYGQQFTAAAPVLQIMLAWMFFSFLTAMLGWVLASIHREKMNALVPVLVAPIYLLLNYLLIPRLSFLGVAWATLVSVMLTYVLLHIFIAKYFVRNLYSFAMLLRLLISSGAMAITVIMIREYSLFGAIAAGAISYIACGFGVRLFTVNDFNSLVSLVLKKKAVVGQYPLGASQ